ncbi:autotransporter-associated beta strand repeat-containing protein [Luteolibacter ambystomatis]|uniref:Autotransporter-associated beta strand repeat-containing protein n=1 Tax=Luteolibacter ambystomatis TaxID=2824561 RepID=A0A975J0C0_9BACT|nr:autotransporter-associated beta strand repeat-containing protein [Luteolibacter ambystomatis]QUE51681.1 autotransporter-associated beta strand repeat-containing protein [Luteolibacter ambystomatis]
MKKTCRFLQLSLLFGSAILQANAADGTWVVTAPSGNWTDAVNWSGSTIADGSGFTANFTSDITATTAVSLNGVNRTIGNIFFSDNGATGSAWTISGNAIILAVPSGSPTVTTDTAATISSILTGTAGLTKAGNDTLVLTAGNTYSGGTAINAGTLQIGDGTTNGTVGTGNYSVVAGSLYLNYATAAAPTWANITGAGTLRLNSAQAVNGSANWCPSAPISLGSGFTGTLQVDRGRIHGVSSGLGGATNIVVGSGAQFLGFTSGVTTTTFSQSFSISGMGWGEGGQDNGALRVSTTNCTFTGNITLTGDSGIYLQNAAGGGITSSGVISGGFNLSLYNALAAGVITLSGANTYTGATTVANGTVSVSNIGNTGFSGNLGTNGTINLGGGGAQGILTYTGSGETTDRVLNFSGTTGGATVNNNGAGLLRFTTATTTTGSGAKGLTFGGTGNGQLDGGITALGGLMNIGKSGAGTWTFAGDLNTGGGAMNVSAGTAVLSGNNSYTGVTTVGAGATLSVSTLANSGVASNIGAATNAAGNLVFAGGTFKYTGGSVSTDHAFTVTAASTLEVTNAATTLTIANTLNAAGGSVILTKTGAGTLVFGGSADNSSVYAAVSAGELDLAKTGTTTRALAGISSVATGTTVKLTGIGPDQIYGGNAGTNYGVNGLAGTLDLNGHSESTSNFNGVTGGKLTNSAAATNATWTVGESNATATFAGVMENGAGTVSLSKIGTGTQTLSGGNTFTGATTLNAGTLVLDYNTQDNSKLSDTGALILNGGTLQMGGVTGTHVEVVGPVTINGNVSITRGGFNSTVLALGNYTNNGVLNIAAAGLATTTVANNGGGYLDNITFAGNQLAMNDGTLGGGLGNIVAASVTYADVNRATGTKTITSSAGSIVRIIEGTGGTSTNITLGAATTDISTLFQTATGGTTITDLGTNVLRLGASGRIFSGTGASALTIQSGTLTAGGADDTAGTIDIHNGSTNLIFVSSKIADNGTGAVALQTTGSVALSGANTYTGGTTVNGGTLSAGNNTGTGATALGTGSATVNTGATLQFWVNTTTTGTTFANNITLNGGTLLSQDGVNNLSGAITIGASGGTFKSQWNAKNLVVNGVVSGTGPVTIDKLAGDGGSKVIFTAANTYTGTTTINGGAAQFTKQVALYNNTPASWTAANLTVASGAIAAFNIGGTGEFTSADIDTLQSLTNVGAVTATQGFKNGSSIGLDTTNAGGNFTYATAIANHVGTVADTLGLAKLGTGTLTLTATNTYTGATAVSGGTLVISGSGSLNSGAYPGAISIASGATFNHASSTAQTFSGGVSGAGALTKTGAGTLTFSNQTTYTGGTTVSQGILDLTGGGGANGAMRGVATINTGATLRLSTGDAAGYDATTRLNTINLVGGNLDVNSTGNQTLGSATINMTGGSITGIAGSNIDFFAGASTLKTFASSTTSTISGTALSPLRQGNTTFTVAPGTTASGIDLDIQGIIRTSPSGDAATSVLTITGGGTVAFSGTNTIAGTATKSLAITGAGTTLMVGNGGATGTLGGLNVTNNSALSFNRSDAAGSFSNIISGTGQLKQVGSGTTTLTGVQTYTGATVVNAGTLLITGSLASGSAVSVDASGTLGGTGTVNGTVTAAGKIAPGTTGTGTLTTGAVVLNGGTYACKLNGATSDKLVVNGSLTLTGATLAISTVSAPTASSYVIATYTGAAPAFTTVTGLPSGYAVDTSTAGQIKLTNAPFLVWAAAQGLTSVNNGLTQDPDHDGLANLLEYVLMANPLAFSSSELPMQGSDANYLYFYFLRSTQSKQDTNVTVQWGTGLASWTDIPIPDADPSDGVVSIDQSIPAYDYVTVKIARSNAVNGKLFVRLKATPKP